MSRRHARTTYEENCVPGLMMHVFYMWILSADSTRGSDPWIQYVYYVCGSFVSILFKVSMCRIYMRNLSADSTR